MLGLYLEGFVPKDDLLLVGCNVDVAFSVKTKRDIKIFFKPGTH